MNGIQWKILFRDLFSKLFIWKNGQFEEMGEDLGIPDVAKTLAWTGDSLCVGFKRDYYLIKVGVITCRVYTIFVEKYNGAQENFDFVI